MSKTPRGKALELVTKFYSEITGIPVDYIQKNMLIKEQIDIIANDSHFITALKCVTISIESQIEMLNETKQMLGDCLYLKSIGVVQGQINELKTVETALRSFF